MSYTRTVLAILLSIDGLYVANKNTSDVSPPVHASPLCNDQINAIIYGRLCENMLTQNNARIVRVWNSIFENCSL